MNRRDFLGLSLALIPILAYGQTSLRTFGAEKSLLEKLQNNSSKKLILISGSTQELFLFHKEKENLVLERKYDISTSKYGFGNKFGSEKTPFGLHSIYQKIGGNASIGTIFDKMRNTGIKYGNGHKNIPLITSRILTLRGEENVNKNTPYRRIYIHGTNLENLLGSPQSKGCIRMANEDVIELYDLVKLGTYVNIVPY